MHIHNLDAWRHSHDFSDDHHAAEKSTQKVIILTAVTMVIEIVAGILFGSMALLADGWHMATHVAAFGMTIFAYRYARRYANSSKYTFGTGKVSALGGFASAIALMVIAGVMAVESIARLLEPQVIQFNQAIAIAMLGLLVNLISGFLLKEHHEHEHHHDHNLRAAYFHVLADALTSVFAIIALLAGKFLTWNWLDPVMGLVGVAVITRWALGLVQDSSSVLLDESVDRETQTAILSAIEQDLDNRVVDLHVWLVGSHHLAATISLVTHYPQAPDYYKALLSSITSLAHVVVEVNPCQGQPCAESLPTIERPLSV
jgi:cation diffusion facilitator family transporter